MINRSFGYTVEGLMRRLGPALLRTAGTGPAVRGRHHYVLTWSWWAYVAFVVLDVRPFVSLSPT